MCPDFAIAVRIQRKWLLLKVFQWMSKGGSGCGLLLAVRQRFAVQVTGMPPLRGEPKYCRNVRCAWEGAVRDMALPRDGITSGSCGCGASGLSEKTGGAAFVLFSPGIIGFGSAGPAAHQLEGLADMVVAQLDGHAIETVEFPAFLSQ